MKTPVALLTSVTVTAAPQLNSNVAVADLTAATLAYCTIEAAITNSANVQTGNNRLYIRYAFSTTNESSNISRLSAQGTLEAHVPAVASAIKIVNTDKITLRSQFLHVWVDHEELSAACTLTVKVVI